MSGATATTVVPASMAPGVYPDLSNEAYHAGPGVSNSQLAKFAKCPALYKYGDQADTAALRFGQISHCAVLEPDEFDKRYLVADPKAKSVSSVLWKETVAIAGDLEVIKHADYEKAMLLQEAVHSHPLARQLLEGCVAEQSAYWNDPDTGLLCRCRPDAWHPELGIIIDFKSTRSSAPREFGNSVWNYGYDVQDAFYTDGWAAASGKTVEGFVFIATESTLPHLTECYELAADDRDRGREKYQNYLIGIQACERSGVWPGYNPDSDLAVIQLPKWAYYND